MLAMIRSRKGLVRWIRAGNLGSDVSSGAGKSPPTRPAAVTSETAEADRDKRQTCWYLDSSISLRCTDNRP